MVQKMLWGVRKIKNTCTITIIPKLLSRGPWIYPNHFGKRTWKPLSAAKKSTDSKSEYERQMRIIEKCFGPCEFQSSNIGKSTITEAEAQKSRLEYTEESECEKCRKLIIKAFQNEEVNHGLQAKSLDNTKLKGTTEKQTEEKLIQRIEELDEVSLVDAETPEAGLSIPPKVLDNDIEFLKFKEYLKKYDELARRCLQFPIHEVDKRLLEEISKAKKSSSNKPPFNNKDPQSYEQYQSIKLFEAVYEKILQEKAFRENYSTILNNVKKLKEHVRHENIKINDIQSNKSQFLDEYSSIIQESGSFLPLIEPTIQPRDYTARGPDTAISAYSAMFQDPMTFIPLIEPTFKPRDYTAYNINTAISGTYAIPKNEIDESLERGEDSTIQDSKLMRNPNKNSLNNPEKQSTTAPKISNTETQEVEAHNYIQTKYTISNVIFPSKLEASDNQANIFHDEPSVFKRDQNMCNMRENNATLLSDMLRKVRERNRLEYCQDYVKKQNEDVSMKCNPCKPPPCDPKPKQPKCKPIPTPCPSPPKPKEPKCKPVPIPCPPKPKEPKCKPVPIPCPPKPKEPKCKPIPIPCPPKPKEPKCKPVPSPCPPVKKSNPCQPKPKPVASPCPEKPKKRQPKRCPPKTKSPCQPKKKDPCAKMISSLFGDFIETNMISLYAVPIFDIQRNYSTQVVTTDRDLEKIGHVATRDDSLKYFEHNKNYVRDYEPWSPIPSWPFPKKEKKQPFVCPEICKILPPRTRSARKEKETSAECPKRKFSILNIEL